MERWAITEAGDAYSEGLQYGLETDDKLLVGGAVLGATCALTYYGPGAAGSLLDDFLMWTLRYPGFWPGVGGYIEGMGGTAPSSAENWFTFLAQESWRQIEEWLD